MVRKAGWSVLVSLIVGCYSPHVGDLLRCAPTGQSCPSGYACIGEYCRSPSDDRAIERPGDAGAEAGVDASQSSDASGDLRQPLEFCTIINRGLPTQTDDCAPGSVCMPDGCEDRCYKFCSDDGDCPGAACDRDVGGGQKACDVPFRACNPVGVTSGCAGSTSSTACYLSSTHPDRTVCDCPFGALGANADCARSRDCIRGLACVDRGNGRPTCLQVCTVASGGADCPGGAAGSCHPYPGTTSGSTNDTFGYCF